MIKIKKSNFLDKKGTWKFDSNIALNFNYIAITNIPDYERVINLSIKIAKKLFNSDSKIIDVGSSIGFTLQYLYNNGFRNIYGVESSEEMIKRSFNKATIINSKFFPENLGKFDYIISNWTLHFIKERFEYIESMYKNLVPGGYVFLTEKVSSSEIISEIYDDFKRKMGLTEEQILTKKNAIEGVLIPYPFDWYIETFKKIGFKDIEVINTYSSFCTFLLRKK